MPYAICKECGRNVCYAVGDEPHCPCQSKDFIILSRTKAEQIADLEYFAGADVDERIVKIIRQTGERFIIFQNYRELYWISDHLKRIGPGVIVEIGCYNGGTLEIWQQFARLGGQNPNKIIGMDVEIARIAVNEKIRSILTLIQVDSASPQAAVRLDAALAGEPIDWAFIDGNHEYAYVKNDFELIWPRVRKGGAVGFHDVNWSENDVGRFWASLKGRKYETREAFGIGVIYKD